ncbi:hypothetical protein AAVH_12298 [Aphelenchoides avenae]|nr:hypothetical protein AAVH_12298 [Aphelenchus avenae]
MPSEKTPARAARLNASEIWKHFTKESPILVRCQRCSKCFKRSSQYDSTTQFWDHLRRHHPEDFLTTQYLKEGLATKDPNRVGKRLSRLGVEAGNGTLAIDATQPEAATAPIKDYAVKGTDGSLKDAEGASEPTEFPFTEDQQKLLEGWFQRIHSHWTEEQGCLAEELDVEENKINDWFHDRMGQEKRGSLTSDHTSLTSYSTQADDDTIDLVDDAQEFEMSEAAGNEVAGDSAPQAMDHDAAAITTAHTENDLAPFAPFDLQAQQLQQSLFQPPHDFVPQPIPIPVQQVQPVENDLVETCGRAMILRLRQLYEKNAKLFLRAQNDVNNAIFKYEDEGL